uniref:Uncharacterized protein n=1 Tax=Siphoviridae sp. ctKwY15 TaxID=2827843 RepID=A0A8S5SU99_9CAUD|nr:MAG TPA: hypothetical protein [Siphoviridae sp. ctKwY15]
MIEEKVKKKHKSRAKRVVIVKFLDKDKGEIFHTCPEIYLKYSKEKVGIGLQALWNALAKGGFYENKKCAIYYQSTAQLKPSVWE